jgi:hypothetical protein
MASPRLTAEDIARLHEVGASLDPIDMVERRDATPPAGAGEAVAEVAERGFVRWLNGENILPIGTKLYAAPTPLPEAVRELVELVQESRDDAVYEKANARLPRHKERAQRRIDRIDAALRAIPAQAQTFVLVPREPTPEMGAAAVRVILRESGESESTVGDFAVATIAEVQYRAYRAMLDAATPPEGAAQGRDGWRSVSDEVPAVTGWYIGFWQGRVEPLQWRGEYWHHTRPTRDVAAPSHWRPLPEPPAALATQPTPAGGST